MNKLFGLAVAAMIFLYPLTVLSQAELIVDVKVRGNAKVEADAIVTVMKTQKGDSLDVGKISQDIATLFDLGYFSDIRVYKTEDVGGVILIVDVKEKPTVSKISFEGMKELSEDDVKDKLATKLYTIANDATIQDDLHIIERMYSEKGYYLVKASYRLDKINDTEIGLVYVFDEGDIVRVGDVYLIGNKYFSDKDILDKVFSRPYTRSSALPIAAANIFQDDFLKRDLEFIAYYYRDNGFVESQVAKPVIQLDQDRKFARITIEIDEGIQYHVGNITITGDLLYTVEELIDEMQLKSKDLFKWSLFQKDIEFLVDKYGDLGYVFTDVNVNRVLNKESDPPTVDLEYQITKGDKVYFGDFSVTGNSKTRDNVIRRELEVFDSELYSGTGLKKSKQSIERLGFFDEVQIIRQRDQDDPSVLNHTIKVKEKMTGNIQASVAFQPGPSSGSSKWFGQGMYAEENQFGKGWQTRLAAKWGGSDNHSLSLDFLEPRLDDGDWSLGFGASIDNYTRDITEDLSVSDRITSAKIAVGRRIVELVRATISYKISKLNMSSDEFILHSFKESGLSSSMTFSVSRNSTNNYLDPSDGSIVSLSQSVVGGPFGGDFRYYETALNTAYYYPIDFSDTYRTYFHLAAQAGVVYPMGDDPVPMSERYRLGGPNDLRGYEYHAVGPSFNIIQNPTGGLSEYPKGGNRQLLFQAEYFFPLIQEAGFKGVLFFDMGRVYDDGESFALKDFSKDVGFGFRWLTPMAPFRFEWAYPIEDGKLGDMQFVFYLGY